MSLNDLEFAYASVRNRKCLEPLVIHSSADIQFLPTPAINPQ
jgi:hypothetical protein